MSNIRALLAVAALWVACSAVAEASIWDNINFLNRLAESPKTLLDSTMVNNDALNEQVIVRGDTVGIVLPQKNYGRYDRGLHNFLFVPRGQWSFGLSASYGELGTDNVQILSILNNLNVKMKAYSIQPTVSYFFQNNQSIGINFNYTRMYVDLTDMAVDFDEDMSFRLSGISYYSTSYSSAFAYRNFVGLGRDRRFGVYNELELSFGGGSSRFKRYYNDELRDTRTNTMTAALNFSPGVCVFIMDYVAFNVSFGVFGINLHHERQATNGIDEGTRFSSGANFRFNLFNIKFGMAVFL